MKFTKPPLRPEEHIALLKARNLLISDTEKAKYYLEKIGYFRLSGYMYPFQVDQSHNFKPDVNFGTIIKHYKFDKKLRLLVLDAIERIEIYLRSMISNLMAVKHGAHWFLDANHFNDHSLHSSFIANLKTAIADSNDLFIKNYMHRYTEPPFPPSWMVMELLTFGSLTSIYCNMKNGEEKQEISHTMGCVTPVLESWLKSINYIRNCCAHHARLWNKKIPLKPIIPVRKGKAFLNNINDETNLRIYGILSCILHILNNINPTCSFKKRLKTLLDEYSDIPKRYMGFPGNFEEEPIWS